MVGATGLGSDDQLTESSRANSLLHSQSNFVVSETSVSNIRESCVGYWVKTFDDVYSI